MSRRRRSPGHPRLFEMAPLPSEIPPLEQPRLFEYIELGSDPDRGLTVGGAGLFVEELALGPGRLDPDDEAAICAHLVAVARARHIPLHVAVAWNALYFGYDPEMPGYRPETCGDIDLPPLVGGERNEALPVGALVQFTDPEGKLHEEWAEVVYKEGRPPAALDDGLIRSEYSGAIGTPGSRVPDNGSGETLCEVLVLDFEPFGAMQDKDRSWLERVRSNPDRHSLDESGHVSVDAFYAPDGARNSDIEYFCDWMLEHHPELLAHGWLGAALEDPDDPEQLAEAMTNSVSAIEATLERSDDFSEWAGYWYLREDLEAFVADPDAHGGRGDAGHLLSSMADVARGERVSYHPLALHLRQVLNADELRYERYARHIVYANVLVAEAIGERETDGVLSRAGENYLVRLDDAWLYGGTWRAERLDDTSICPLVGFDPTITLGLGATGEEDDRHIEILDRDDAEETGTETAAEQGASVLEHEEAGRPLSGEPFAWSAVLREAHRIEERIWVHPDAKLTLGPEGHIVVRLVHDGEIEEDERVQSVELSANGGWLHPVRFPLDFFTGIRLLCLAQRGGSVVWVSTESLPAPVDLGGHAMGFAFDHHMIDPAHARQREPRLADRALRTIDRYGEEMGERWRRLDSGSIAELIFGAEVRTVGAQAVTSALEELPKVTTCDLEGFWWHRSNAAGRRVFEPHTKRSGGIFAGASGGQVRLWSGAGEQHRREHRVVLHLRRLQVSEQAPPEREAAYAALRDRAPNRASLPKELPPGYTYVVSHTRGRKGENYA